MVMSANLRIVGFFLLLLPAAAMQAQSPARSASPASSSAVGPTDDLAAQVRELRAAVAALTAQVQRLQQGASAARAVATVSAETEAKPEAAVSSAVSAASSSADTAAEVLPVYAAADKTVLDGFRGTTLSATLDGYYGYNFNKPPGRANQLRAYDLSSNSFSINQAAVILEHAPDVAAGNRFGGRLDLQFGQATQTLQGSAANELHPEVWRNVFQAYGSYVVPVGSGLQVDFGKFASALGVEGNYSKDQINYTRSYYFNYLPFYHTGLRANYNVTPKVGVTYWLVNGAQQTDDFNGFKSQAFLFTVKPAKTVTWQVNYYFGQEGRDTTLAGEPVSPAPDGREHIFDTYATWTPTPKLTLVGEADLVVNRTHHHASPQHVDGGAAYVRYQLAKQFALAARGEYLADPSGLFSGAGQALKEVTFTGERALGRNLVLRAEYRRDFSNQRYFLTSDPLVFSHAQGTATLGAVWWWGGKEGSW